MSVSGIAMPQASSTVGVRTGPEERPEAGRAASPDALLRQLSASNPALSFSSTAIATALERSHAVSIVANLAGPTARPDQLRCWRCTRQGVQLHLDPFMDEAAGNITAP